MIVFEIQVVGGPFDGAPGMTWNDDGEHPPPEVIFVGACAGRGECGALHCGHAPRARRHVAYWVEGLEDVPQGTVKYRKEDEYGIGEAFAGAGELGIARYAFGSIDHFRSLGTEAEEGILSDTREKTLVGA